jgi:hypothetical protein
MRSSSRHFCVDRTNAFSNRFQPHLLNHSPCLTAGFPTLSLSSSIPPFHLRRFLCSCAVSALLLHSLRCVRLSYAYVVTGLVMSGSICQVSLQFPAIFSHVVTRSRPHTSRSRSRSLPTRVFNALARAHARSKLLLFLPSSRKFASRYTRRLGCRSNARQHGTIRSLPSFATIT